MNSGFRTYFGGSFYPPHRGHDEMLCHLLSMPMLNSVVLVPTFQNPLKTPDPLWQASAPFKRELVDAWPSSLRSRALQAVDGQSRFPVRTCDLAKLRVEWREVEASEPTYTIDTLSQLQEEDPGDWVLCLGEDSLASLPLWKNVDLLLKRVEEVWVFCRGAHKNPTNVWVDSLPTSLRDRVVWRMMTPMIQDVSSTQIREGLVNQRTRSNGFCDDSKPRSLSDASRADAWRFELEDFLLPEVARLLVDSIE